MDTGKSSQLGTRHGFGSLRNLTWTWYHNEDILLRHWLWMKLTILPLIHSFRLVLNFQPRSDCLTFMFRMSLWAHKQTDKQTNRRTNTHSLVAMILVLMVVNLPIHLYMYSMSSTTGFSEIKNIYNKNKHYLYVPIYCKCLWGSKTFAIFFFLGHLAVWKRLHYEGLKIQYHLSYKFHILVNVALTDMFYFVYASPVFHNI